MAKPIFPLLISSLTASEHNPHNHFPSNLAFTSRIYSWVQSSLRPQHSHLTDSTSISTCKDKFFLNSYLPFKEGNENLRITAATGGFFFFFSLVGLFERNDDRGSLGYLLYVGKLCAFSVGIDGFVASRTSKSLFNQSFYGV